MSDCSGSLWLLPLPPPPPRWSRGALKGAPVADNDNFCSSEKWLDEAPLGFFFWNTDKVSAQLEQPITFVQMKEKKASEETQLIQSHFLLCSG